MAPFGSFELIRWGKLKTSPHLLQPIPSNVKHVVSRTIVSRNGNRVIPSYDIASIRTIVPKSQSENDEGVLSTDSDIG